MTATTTNPPARPGRIKRILGLLLRTVGMLVAAAALAGGGFAAGWVYFSNPESPVIEALNALAKPAQTDGEPMHSGPPDPEDMPQKVPLPTPEEEKFATTYYTFAEPLMTNLAGSRRYLQVGVSLSTQYDAAVMANVEMHKAALQSDMLAVVGTFTEEDLKGPEGRDRLGLALRDAVNRRLEELEGFGGVENVFFPSFVMQ
jgi:flagellar FliL protein